MLYCTPSMQSLMYPTLLAWVIKYKYYALVLCSFIFIIYYLCINKLHQMANMKYYKGMLKGLVKSCIKYFFSHLYMDQMFLQEGTSFIHYVNLAAISRKKKVSLFRKDWFSFYDYKQKFEFVYCCFPSYVMPAALLDCILC